eukprot:COSAG06_NODE_2392_length_6963_cov_2.989365_4_plen_433_part_00
MQSAPDSTSTPVNLPDTGASPSDETSSSDDTLAATVPAEGPPKALSSYMIFSQAIQKSSPEMFEGMAMKDKLKEVGKQWNLLDESGKAPYEQEAQERKAKRKEWEQTPDGIQWKIQDKQAKDEKKKAKQKKEDDKMEQLTKMSAEDEWIKNTTKEQKDKMQKAAGTDKKIKPGEVKKALKQRWAEMDPAERQTLEKAKSEQIAAYRKKHPTSSSRSELAEPAAAAAGPSVVRQQQLVPSNEQQRAAQAGMNHLYDAAKKLGAGFPPEVQRNAFIRHASDMITGTDGREITAQLKAPMVMMTPDLFSSNTVSSASYEQQQMQQQMQLEPAPDIAGGGDFMNFMANTDDGDSSPTSSVDVSPQSSPAIVDKPRSAAAAAAPSAVKKPTIQKKKSGLHGGGGGLHGKKSGGLHGGGLKRKGGGLHGGDKRVKIEN